MTGAVSSSRSWSCVCTRVTIRVLCHNTCLNTCQTSQCVSSDGSQYLFQYVFHTTCLNMCLKSHYVSQYESLCVSQYVSHIAIRVSYLNTCLNTCLTSQYVSHVSIRVSRCPAALDWRGLVAYAAAATLCTPAPLTLELSRSYMCFSCACPHVPQYVSQDPIRDV